MAQLISEIWEGLRAAGLPEVMLYLADNSASRCHWEDTTLINGVRVALLADQDRQIVRILPVDSCVGIGIASPKGTDPSGYKRVIFNKLTNGEDPAEDKEAGTLRPRRAARHHSRARVAASCRAEPTAAAGRGSTQARYACQPLRRGHASPGLGPLRQ